MAPQNCDGQLDEATWNSQRFLNPDEFEAFNAPGVDPALRRIAEASVFVDLTGRIKFVERIRNPTTKLQDVRALVAIAEGLARHPNMHVDKAGPIFHATDNIAKPIILFMNQLLQDPAIATRVVDIWFGPDAMIQRGERARMARRAWFVAREREPDDRIKALGFNQADEYLNSRSRVKNGNRRPEPSNHPSQLNSKKRCQTLGWHCNPQDQGPRSSSEHLWRARCTSGYIKPLFARRFG